MKKIIAMLLTLAMLFAFAGCGAPADPKATVVDAYNKTLALTHSDISMDITMNTKVPFEMAVEMPMETKAIKEGDAVTAMYVKADISGIEIEATYVDGTIYTAAMGMKQKASISVDEFLATMDTEILPETDMSTAIESAQAAGKDDAGNDKYNVVLNDSYFTALVEDQVGANLGDLGTDLDDMNLSYDTTECTISVNKDGYMTAMTLSMAASMELEGEASDISISIDTTYNNPGKTFEISAPEDADEYEESTEDLGDIDM